MKHKLLSVALVILLMSSSAFAQMTYKVGIGGGLNISNLSFYPGLPYFIEKSSKTNYRYGLLAEFGFMPSFAIQVEPMYVQGGAKFATQLYDGTTNLSFKLSYFEIPILLKLKFPNASPITPYVFAGPDIGILKSASSSDEGDVKKRFTSTDIALDFGAGAGYQVAPIINLIIDARYSTGMFDILKKDGTEYYSDYFVGSHQIKTKGIQIDVGVMFTL